ncbi:restriction endonuclease subunit S [Comamonas sp. Y6]|uniref:Restriction endonuclease subunit S n=1 Tax=Comamonas resistens TaxID=3046670 RepID=A0ABY8SVI4_9BURK|nr:restriction endonuclease subunit S [Comamonas resistens]MDL5036732.1 restriction endonuclease subunit S [Comamonas resistens]WHS67045.1 restriction endonuclease subunit S [Comamonas resistens]
MLKTSTDQRKLLPNFEQLFATTAQAPGGVARLRELILTLAVQGKLVPQDPSDEPASELLKKIRAEKDRLIAEGKIKKDKPLAVIAEEEKPFELPVGWEWVRLGALTELITSGSRDWAEYYSDFGPIFLRMGNLSKGSYRLRLSSLQHVIPPKGGEGSRTSLIENDLLLSITGDVGMLGLIPKNFGEAYINQHTCLIRWMEILRNEFFPMQMLSNAIQDQLNAPQRGVKNSFRLSDVSGVILALPPLAEQSRIVARVEALMRLCDALEEKGRLEHTQHQQLLQAMLDSLTQTTDARDLARHWQRLAQHFDLLIDRPEAVDALEQTILQLAVRGLLVPQDPSDEPASELLKKIRAEKDRLIAEGKIKKDKPLPAIGENEKPFELPDGWNWTRVSEICSIVTDGEHATPQRIEDPSQVPLVTAKNVRSEFMDYSVTDYVPRNVAEQCWKRCKPELGDVLMVSVGATTGRLCVLREEVDMVLVRSVTLLRAVKLGIDISYFALNLMSCDTQREIWGSVKQSAQPCLYLAKSAALKIALPPLAEQSRIVARVTELRALCQQLREKLAQARHTQTQLAQAWVEQAAA